MNPNYSERLALAMKQGACSTSALASALGVSYQAVKKVLDGKSNALTAENNAKAARFLKVSSHWLATGDGAMDTSHTTKVAKFPVATLEVTLERLSSFLDQVPQAERGSSSAALAALALNPQDHARKAAMLRLLIEPAPNNHETPADKAQALK